MTLLALAACALIVVFALLGRGFMMVLERAGFRAPSRPPAVAGPAATPAVAAPRTIVVVAPAAVDAPAWTPDRAAAWSAALVLALRDRDLAIVPPERWRPALNLARRRPAELHADDAIARAFLADHDLELLLLWSVQPASPSEDTWRFGFRLLWVDGEARAEVTTEHSDPVAAVEPRIAAAIEALLQAAPEQADTPAAP